MGEHYWAGARKNILIFFPQDIHTDLDNFVYTDTADFSNRVMKRIKKKKRTDSVMRVVYSLRSLIESAETQGKEINLDAVSISEKKQQKANWILLWKESGDVVL